MTTPDNRFGRRKALLLSSALLAAVTPVAAVASDTLIFDYSSYAGTQTNLANAQIAAGNTATIVSPGSAIALSGYAQVWDLGFSTPLTSAQISDYTAYLQSGGTLFLMGENAGFITRDNSITSLVAALGGGTVSVASTNSPNSQTIDPQFLIVNQTSAVSFAAIGQFASVGTGTCITSGCGAAAWGVGTLSGATSGTIISVLDVNFLDNTYLQSSFVSNLIGYLTQQAQIGNNPIADISTTDGSALASQVGISVSTRFSGGTLTADQDSTAAYTVTASGGTINADGGSYTFSGGFSNDSSAAPGAITIIDTVGGGRIVLMGSNSFSGGFSVESGAHLSIGDGASLGSGTLELAGTSQTPAYLEVTGTTTIANSITVAGDPVLDIAQGTTTTISGTISDGASAGDLVKQGDGTLLLTAANSYTGGTVVDAGTLVLSGNGTLGATSASTTVNGGTLDLGGTTQVQDGGLTITGGTVQNGTLSSAGIFALQGGTIGASLTGSGSVVQSSGTTTLSGVNSYTGGTVISGGTLALSGAGSIAGSAVTDNGTLDISGLTATNTSIQNLNGSGLVALGANTLTVSNGSGSFTGVLSGTGGFTLGGGSLTLSGANSYTGTTTIASGATLTGSSASLSGGTILDNGTLAVNQNTNGTLTQAVSGSGVLVKTGAATLTLVGANSYTGGTLVSAGRLTGNSTSLQGAIIDNGTVEFTQSADGSYAGAITGSGALIKSGSAALSLTGASTISGTTSVTAGRLAVNGTLGTSLLSVASGGTLGGSGTVNGAVSVLSGGTLAPGNSPGTLTVNGNVTLATGSTTAVDIDGRTYTATGGAGSYDRLVVNGTFTAGGTLAPLLRGITGAAGNSFTPVLGDSFTVVSATKVNGTFTTVAQPVNGLADNTRFDALYGTSTVQLVVTPASFARLGTAQGWNRNTMATATAFDGVRDVVANQALFNQLYGLDAVGYGLSLSQLSGQVYAHALQNFADVAQGTLHIVRDSADTTASGEHGMALWGDYLNIGQSLRDSDRANGYKTRNQGFVMGLTLLDHEHVRFGVAGSYSHNRLDTGIGSRARSDSASGYVYGVWAPTDRFDLTSVAGFTRAAIDTSRTTYTTAGNLSAGASDDVFAAQLTIDARLRVAHAGGLSLYGVAGLEGTSIDAGRVAESADSSALALSLPATKWQMLQSRLGGQLEQKLPFATISLHADWTRQLADMPTATRLVALAGTQWSVQSVGTDRSGITWGGALKANLGRTVTARVQYDRADAGVGQHSDRASAGVSLAF